jgi:hypothetical protein
MTNKKARTGTTAKTTAGPSIPLAAKNAANFAQDDFIFDGEILKG